MSRRYRCEVCGVDFSDPCNAGVKTDEGWLCKDYTDGPSHCRLVMEAVGS